MASPKSLKVTLRGDTRRFNLAFTRPDRFAELRAAVRQLYGLRADAPLVLRYKDDEVR